MNAPVSIEERARRVDAALAEVGYPVGSAFVDDGYVSVSRSVNRRDFWRAGQIAGQRSTGGWTCLSHANGDGDFDPQGIKRCQASQPLTEDCGVDRSHLTAFIP